jgi:hypothetical protein
MKRETERERDHRACSSLDRVEIVHNFKRFPTGCSTGLGSAVADEGLTRAVLVAPLAYDGVRPFYFERELLDHRRRPVPRVAIHWNRGTDFEIYAVRDENRRIVPSNMYTLPTGNKDQG